MTGEEKAAYNAAFKQLGLDVETMGNSSSCSSSTGQDIKAVRQNKQSAIGYNLAAVLGDRNSIAPTA